MLVALATGRKDIGGPPRARRMARMAVLGGGFGGITAARELRTALPAQHEVTLVDEGGTFLMGLAKLWALDGRRPLAGGRRLLADLQPGGVQLVKERVEAIDVAAHSVRIGGRALGHDHLVIALGARLAPEAVPGFEKGHDLYDPIG